ncbi:MAG: preprotein translocase subunit YajC [Clostridia bacterium]|nr:preprotein translocase subunit YajC [Clostridia bacterium]
MKVCKKISLWLMAIMLFATVAVFTVGFNAKTVNAESYVVRFIDKDTGELKYTKQYEEGSKITLADIAGVYPEKDDNYTYTYVFLKSGYLAFDINTATVNEDMDLVVVTTKTANAKGCAAGGNISTYIIMGVMLVAIIGLFAWQSISNKKKQKKAQEMTQSMKAGDKIKTIGGVCGYLVSVNDAENTIVIRTGDEKTGTLMKFDKGAIYQTAPANDSTSVNEEKEDKPEEKKD